MLSVSYRGWQSGRYFTFLSTLVISFCVLQIPNSEALEVETYPLHEGLVDGSVVLNCSYDEPAEFADQYIYTWSYITEGSDKITIFINNGGEEQSFGEYAGRVSTAGDYASLQIDNLVISDTGNYECDVDFYVSGDQGVAITHLDVYKLVDGVDIMGYSTGEYVSVVPGDVTTMTCNAYRGYPEAVLVWYLDNVVVGNGNNTYIDNGDGTYDTTSELDYTFSVADHDKAMKCQSDQTPEIQQLQSDYVMIDLLQGEPDNPTNCECETSVTTTTTTTTTTTNGESTTTTTVTTVERVGNCVEVLSLE
uniref:CD276 antigen-like n=1 Tax=Saccoglossus kowalevskii TaxID=10224 RepID=A0ABM0M9U4_SACKO|nr:PREDICTED: CD276 antigen-like [Saccoglossus kowalevskii]